MKSKNLWISIKICIKTLWAFHFSIIMLFLGFLFLAIIPQGKDTILALSGSINTASYLKFILYSLFWAFQIWYWARVMVYLKFPNIKDKNKIEKFIIIHGPRIIGLLSLLSIAFSALSMFLVSKTISLFILGFSYIVLAGLFFGFVYKRRKMFGLKKLDRENNTEKNSNKNSGMFDLPKSTIITVLISVIVSIVFFIYFVIDPQISSFAGTASIILLCLSILIPLGSLISYLSYRIKKPVFTVLIIIFMVLGLFNDNNSIRLLKSNEINQTEIQARIHDFFKMNYKNDPVTNNQAKRVYIAVTEGGGIRAAFWTASVLGQIQDLDKNFNKKLFAVSSVSGSSLGTAVYASLLKENQKRKKSKNTFADNSKEILKNDFLSPTISCMFTGNLLQRIIPFAIPHFSRGNALEKAWENAWRNHIRKEGNNKCDYFSKSFLSLWDNDEACEIPNLFMNGTWAETGKRIITSNICINENLENFPDAFNAFKYINNDIRLSTAVLNSARFPYVSPAGTLKDDVHIVDGGYFDNSGATTALEIAKTLKTHINGKYKLTVLYISNYTEICKKKKKRFTLLEGTLIPVFTILNVRTAHASLAVKKLQEYVESKEINGEFIIIKPNESEIQYPLGWALSDDVIIELSKQAGDKVKEIWTRQ